MTCPVASTYCLDARARIAEVPITETVCPAGYEQFVWRLCAECGDETMNARLCRDCDLADLMARSSCPECGWFQMRDELYATGAPKHAAGCSKEVR